MDSAKEVQIRFLAPDRAIYVANPYSVAAAGWRSSGGLIFGIVAVRRQYEYLDRG
jgi:hypothetical protein